MSATAVEPLRCASCGAPVPLGTTDAATCPHCRAIVPLPPALIALRQAELERTRAEEGLAALYQRLGAPPGLLLRLWGGFVGDVARLGLRILSFLVTVWGWALGLALASLGSLADPRVLLVVVVAPLVLAFIVLSLGLAILAELVRAGTISFGADALDLWPPAIVFLVSGALVTALTALPKALFDRLDALAGVRRNLQASLSARPPDRAGAAASCRLCGGALDVPAGAAGARCLYCRADNLVSIPGTWLSRAKELSTERFVQLQAADAEERRIRAEANAKLRKDLVLVLLAPGLFAGAGLGLVLAGIIDWREGWHEAVAAPRALLERPCPPFWKDDPIHCFGGTTGLFDFALRAGETAELTESGDDRSGGAWVTHFSDMSTVEPLAEQRADVRTIRFVAPADGWYTLRGAKPDARWKLKVRR